MAYPISAAYQTALTAGSQNIVTQATLMSDGSSVANLSVVSGAVTIDSTSQFYRSFSLKVVDLDGSLTPKPSDLTDLVLTQPNASAEADPYGMEVALYRGLVGYPLVPLGVFRITKVLVTDTPTDYYLTLSGYDRSYTVAQQRWTDIYTIAAGTNTDTAIQAIITPRMPTTVQFTGFNHSTTTPLLTYALDSGTDPWSVCASLAQSNGCVVYFDVNGNPYQTPPPIPGLATTPVWSFIEGPTCTITSVESDFVTENVSNDVIVLGEGTGVASPAYGRASVVNPANPMNINGPYGDCPQVIRSNLATTNTIAQAMAQTQLYKNTGLTQQIQLQCIPAPQLDVYDVIYVQTTRSGIANPYIINHLSTPLEPASLQTITAQLSAVLA